MSISLVLSGGAARGAFELGVLQYFDEQNIQIKNISGSSIGAVIACSYASGVKPKEILEIFKTQEMKKAIKFRFSNILKGGLFSIDLNSSLINKLFPIKNIEDIPKDIFVCVYDLKAKKIEYLNKGDVVQSCLASTALVPVFHSIKMNNKLYIDGGLKDNLPITPLLNFKEKIVTIDLFPSKTGSLCPMRKLNPITAIKKILFKDMIKNSFISLSKSDYVVTNEELRNTKILSFENLDYNFNLGYESAKDFSDLQNLRN